MKEVEIMYKVFIVEDEHLICDHLRKLLLSFKSDLPIRFAGEASDGEMGLAMMLDVKPDILITDIRMPFMNGLLLAKEAKKYFPWLRIIFISGFNDFDYAKTAIQLGVDEYLLKPIKKEELYFSLKKGIEKLESLKNTMIHPADYSQNFMIDIKKNHFLNGLFKGELSMQEFLEESQNFKRNFVGKKYTVLLATNKYDVKFADYYRFSEYLNYLFGNDEHLIFSSISSNYIKFLVSHSNKKSLLGKCYQLANTLIHELEKESTYEIVIAFRSVVERISEIKTSFIITEQLIHTHSNLRIDKVISYEDDIKDNSISSVNLFKVDLANKIASLKPENRNALIVELTGQTGETDERNRLYRFFILTELINLLQKRTNEQCPFNLDKLSNMDYLSSLSVSIDDYQALLTQLFDYLMTNQINPSMIKYKPIIQKALDYIEAHFNDPDISLHSVADEVSLSPSHFSTIFSQSMNCTFIEYLINQRISYAKKLLKETDDKLASITIDIGYNDPNYFSYLFKKKEKISPNEYRKHYRFTQLNASS